MGKKQKLEAKRQKDRLDYLQEEVKRMVVLSVELMMLLKANKNKMRGSLGSWRR